MTDQDVELSFRPSRKMDPAVVTEMANLLRSGIKYDDAIFRMRSLGFNKIECIKLLRDYTGLKTGQAKDIVHLSPAWEDHYDSDEALHDAAEQALAMSDEEAAAALDAPEWHAA